MRRIRIAVHHVERLLRHPRRALLLLFLGVGLPLWAFGHLAEDVHEDQRFGWDVPVLEFLHRHASATADVWMLHLSGVVYYSVAFGLPFLLVIGFVIRRRSRPAFFLATAVGGSAAIAALTKALLQRSRPDLWPSLTSPTSYSFPSGHAMNTMSAALALVFLAWNTRLRVPVLAFAIPIVLAVATSRLYLGVHYPSDILAGWAAAVAWTTGVRGTLYRVENDDSSVR